MGAGRQTRVGCSGSLRPFTTFAVARVFLLGFKGIEAYVGVAEGSCVYRARDREVARRRGSLRYMPEGPQGNNQGCGPACRGSTAIYSRDSVYLGGSPAPSA